MVKFRVSFFILLFACQIVNGFAAEKPAEKEKGYEDPLGRTTPQGTVIGFLKAASQEDYDRAIQYLDTKKKGPDAQKLIHALQIVLERGSSGKQATMSIKPEGHLDDGLPPNKERIGTVETATGSFDIFLERIQRGSSPPLWLFSAETLNRVFDVSQELDVSTIEDYLPKFLVKTWILWFPLWRWLAILLVIPLTFILATLLTRLITSLLLRYSQRKVVILSEKRAAKFSGPIRILVFSSAIWVIALFSRSMLTAAFLGYMAATLSVIGATWLCLRLFDIYFEMRERQLTATASAEKLSLLHLGEKLLKILIVSIGALFIFYMAGVNLTAVVAGLGVGGIAVAFAAQKTLENLFGGITVVSDQPIRVGDFCRAGDYQGTVMAIGLRSTRFRTPARTVVSIPNGQLATMNLENFSLRDKIWFNHILSLRYETGAEQLRYVLAAIRELLYSHPKVESLSARVRFIGFGDSSLKLEIFAYVLEADYAIFLQIQEDLLLRIMDIVAASGSGFAFPSQTTYLAQDSGMDKEKSEKAILQVRQWREKGELPFPDFSPETISQINNRIEYPPPDSAQGKKRKE